MLGALLHVVWTQHVKRGAMPAVCEIFGGSPVDGIYERGSD
jgi:hypothetical protein